MKISHILILCTLFASSLGLVACVQQSDSFSTLLPDSNSNTRLEKKYEDLIVGYAQLGAESEWRAANTISIKETAEQLGVELRFLDAQQKQDNQIEAVRKLIIQKVDIIGISPIVETGWEEVFQEAKNAGIPIILVDRRADVPEDFYVSYQINAYTRESGKQALIYSNLHQNIQDVCNERGIEILSPHYRAARDGNMTTIPANYLPYDYKAPSFNVKVETSNDK